MSDTSTEKDEAKLEQLAKKLLSTKPKPRQDMAVKKRLTKSAQLEKQGGPTAKQDHPEES